MRQCFGDYEGHSKCKKCKWLSQCVDETMSPACYVNFDLESRECIACQFKESCFSNTALHELSMLKEEFE